MYYGAYVSTGRVKKEYYDEALNAIQEAIKIDSSEPSFYFNYATIIQDKDLGKAVSLMEKCIEMNDKEDDDHLALAYKLFRKANNSKATSVLERLEKANPYLAFMVKRDDGE